MYQVCTNCVMDTSDTRISFDEFGVCDHCNDFKNNVKPNWNVGLESKQELANIIEKIKKPDMTLNKKLTLPKKQY